MAIQRILQKKNEASPYSFYGYWPEYSKEDFIFRIKNDPDFAKIWGELGPVYGKQWRAWDKRHSRGNTIDQIKEAIATLRKNPDSRRIIVTAWNPEDISSSLLPPCHCLFQFYARDGKLSCQLYQRSADVFLGVPFNIASYALLTTVVAQVTGLETFEFIHTFGDVHIYLNHIEQVKQQLGREPKKLPSIQLNPAVKDIDTLQYEHIELFNYRPHSAIKAPVAV